MFSLQVIYSVDFYDLIICICLKMHCNFFRKLDVSKKIGNLFFIRYLKNSFSIPAWSLPSNSDILLLAFGPEQENVYINSCHRIIKSHCLCPSMTSFMRKYE